MAKSRKNVSLAQLERFEQIADDIKKVFAFNKHEGTWSWADKDEVVDPELHHGPFPTRFDALVDAVEPYIDGESEG